MKDQKTAIMSQNKNHCVLLACSSDWLWHFF